MEKKYYLRGLGLGIIVTAIIMGITLSGGIKKREMTDDEVIARAKELGMIEDSRLLDPSEQGSGKTSTDTNSGEGNQNGEENPAQAAAPVKKDVAVKTEAEKKDTAEADSSDKTEGAAAAEQKPTVDTPEPVETTASGAETKPKANTNEMTKQDDDEKPASSGTEKANGTKPASSETAQGNDTKPASGGTKSITIVGGDSSYTVAKKLEAVGVVSSASSYDTYLCEHGYDKKIRTGTFQIPAGATDEQIAKIVSGQ